MWKMLPSAPYTHFFDCIFKWKFRSKKLPIISFPTVQIS